MMATNLLRQQLQRQIEHLPDDVLQEVADFMAFVLARRRYGVTIDDWDDETWQRMALEQFFREEDEVEYSLEDAVEVYVR